MIDCRAWQSASLARGGHRTRGPESLRERVFDSFYRPADNDSEGDLGLSIVRRVADRHAAHIAMGGGEATRKFHVDVTFDTGNSPSPPGENGLGDGKRKAHTPDPSPRGRGE
jgi:hypothetical protein